MVLAHTANIGDVIMPQGVNKKKLSDIQDLHYAELFIYQRKLHVFLKTYMYKSNGNAIK